MTVMKSGSRLIVAAKQSYQFKELAITPIPRWSQDPVLHWSVTPKPPEYRCMARLDPQTGGGYTAYVPDLPGVISEGDTKEEAVANIKEALAEALASYLDGSDGIPWEPSARPADHGEMDRWISVDV